MSNDEFNKVELPAIKQLQSMGWTYFEGKNLSPEESDERASLKDVILEKRLRNSLKRINPWINDQNLSKVIRDLTSLSSFSFLEANQELRDKLVNFISVEQDIGKGRKNQTVKIIDFVNISNNEFILPGISTYIVNGHTTGQQLIKIESQGETLIFCSDLIPLESHLKLPWIMGYDLNAQLTLREKTKFLKLASKNNWWLFFYHDPNTIAVKIKNDEKYYKVIEKIEIHD